MSYEIKWLEEAELTITQNMDYLLLEWGKNIVDQFVIEVEDALRKIKLHPYAYPLHLPAKNVRKYPVNKRIILYYRIINESKIELLTFWNTYRNPKDLNVE